MLTLYYKPTCPFCQKVFAASDAMGIAFDLRDVSEDEATRDELIATGGKKQVPFLMDTNRGVSMYESDDIIAYLHEHYPTGNGAPKPRIHVSDATCVSCEG